MPLARLDQKLVAGIAGLFLLPAALAAAALVVLYRWGAFADAFTLLVTVVVGLAAMMGYLGLIAHTIGHGLVRAIRQMQLGTELIATANPGHRLEISTGDELQRLAEEINHLADRLATARQDGERAAASAAAGLAAERAHLARVLDALGDGVLVVTTEGRVSLANGAVRALLGEDLLGRALGDIGIDATPVLRAAENFRAGARVPHRVALQTSEAGLLDAVVAPLVESAGRLAGLAVIIRDRAGEGVGAVGGGTRARPRGAGLASGAGAVGAREAALDLYDFSLLDEVDRHLRPDDRMHPLDRLTCTVLDVETTGLDPARGDRIVSIACVRIRNGVVRAAEKLDILVNPGRSIPPESARIHGITDATVAGAPTVEAVLPEIVRFAADTVLVGHHVAFDLGFLRQVTDGLGLPPLTHSHPVLDTRMLSEIVHGSFERHDLDTLCGRLGVVPRGRHSALGDAGATAEILVRLVALLGRRGVGTLGDALDAMRDLRGRMPSRLS